MSNGTTLRLPIDYPVKCFLIYDSQDKTNDLAMKHRRRGGLLRALSDRQSDVRELLATIRDEQDKTIEEGLAGNVGYSDDQIIAVVLTSLEMSEDSNRPVEVRDVIFAGEFLDHLDTMNMTVRAKARQRFHPPDGHNMGRGSGDAD